MAPHPIGGDTLLRGALNPFRTSSWLREDPRPLDWNGPLDRPFTHFRDQDLDRPIIEHFERAARQQRGRVAVSDADTALTFGELWNGVSALAETLRAETKAGDLIGILLPACPRFPLAMLACLAAGRPFVALDTHHSAGWLDRVLQDARPPLIIAPEDGLPGVEARMPALRVIRLTRDRPNPARWQLRAVLSCGRETISRQPPPMRPDRRGPPHRRRMRVL